MKVVSQAHPFLKGVENVGFVGKFDDLYRMDVSSSENPDSSIPFGTQEDNGILHWHHAKDHRDEWCVE